jgi:hypothetical protein
LRAGQSARFAIGASSTESAGASAGDGRSGKVALMMWLDGKHDALVAYRDHGVRASWEPVASVYRRYGLADLLERPEFA